MIPKQSAFLFLLAAVVILSGVFAYSLTMTKHVEIKLFGDQPADVDAPMIILIGGSEGGFLHAPYLSDMLVAEGFSVSTLAYFGFDGGPEHLREIDLDALTAAINKLSGNTYHRTGRCVGIIGVSKGGELALSLVAYRTVADAILAVVPSHVVWQSPEKTLKRRSSWRLNRKAMPFVPYPQVPLEDFKAMEQADQYLQLHEKGLENTEAVNRAGIPVEQINIPVLLQAAEQDKVWPSLAMSKAMIDRADELNAGHDITMKSYPHGHDLLRSSLVRRDIVAYFVETLKERCTAG